MQFRLKLLLSLASCCFLLYGCGGGGGGASQSSGPEAASAAPDTGSGSLVADANSLPPSTPPDAAGVPAGLSGASNTIPPGTNDPVVITPVPPFGVPSTGSLTNNSNNSNNSNSSNNNSNTTVPPNTGSGSSSGSGGVTNTVPNPVAPLTYFDAWRLADQATFGPTEALVSSIKSQSAEAWLTAQMALRQSRYTSGGSAAIHQSATWYCDIPANNANGNCWRDSMSTVPLTWDFYRNAVTKTDQLRQRVAFALQQILVVSGLEVEGTYGIRNYQNAFIDNAFGNYREVIRGVIQSPVMGDYLNNVNNDKAAPNENFARELLQLFTVGTCDLNSDGSLRGGRCAPTYNNETVRAYAYALSGWTYPSGGSTSCWPAAGTNCRFYNGDMVPAESLHDREERKLLSNVTVPAAQGAQAALGHVLDSLMSHPNIAPFIGRQLIQHLVSANPSAAYVQRVSGAFTAGRFQSGSSVFGAGQRGDLAATVAAVLLDPEARGPVASNNAGKLREPVLLFTGVLRMLNGRTDGDGFTFWWGDLMRQHVFRAPSVFNFYPPDFPVPGTGLMGPSFALHGASASLQRLNFLTMMIDWGGLQPEASVPAAIGSTVDLTAFKTDAADAAKLVDRMSLLAIGQPLAAAKRAKVIQAVEAYNGTSQALDRVKSAAYLVLASPEYQVQR